MLDSIRTLNSNCSKEWSKPQMASYNLNILETLDLPTALGIWLSGPLHILNAVAEETRRNTRHQKK